MQPPRSCLQNKGPSLQTQIWAVVPIGLGGLVFSPRWVWGPQLPPSPVPPARLYEPQSPHTCPFESTWDTLRVPPCDTLSKIHWTALGPGEAG